MELTQKIRDLAQSTLTDESFFIVDVIFAGKYGPSKKLLIIVDGDNGVTIDDCADISRELSKALDDANLMEEHYMLEVSTPGLEHPLKLKRQFKKNTGRSLKVQLKDKSLLQGKLTEADNEKIVLEQEIKEGKKTEIITRGVPFEEIEKAFVLVSFK